MMLYVVFLFLYLYLKKIKLSACSGFSSTHKCLIVLIYSCGLRRSEAINLKIADIDSSRMLIKIRGGKGHKDRYVQLADSLLKILRTYYREYKPKIYIFEGKIVSSIVQRVFLM
jgi:site-specific recombinase XerD